VFDAVPAIVPPVPSTTTREELLCIFLELDENTVLDESSAAGGL